MKIRDKIIFLLFITNVLGIIVFPVLIYCFINAKISFEIFQIIYALFTIPMFIFWIYNIRFLWKYDKYSGRLIPLICLNTVYAPFYYYGVKIKKRPLKNRINTESVLDKIIVKEEVK